MECEFHAPGSRLDAAEDGTHDTCLTWAGELEKFGAPSEDSVVTLEFCVSCVWCLQIYQIYAELAPVKED